MRFDMRYDSYLNRKRDITQQKLSAPSDSMRGFYYANTYPEDVQKARNMQNNVHFDLKPFSAYIRASIDHIGKSTAEGADVVIVDKLLEQYLIPQFTLIKPKLSGAQFTVKRPERIYALNAEEDFDSESFEVSGRQGQVCSHSNKVDTFNGTVFVRLCELSQDISGKKFDLYDDLNHKDDSIKCTISAVDYSAVDSYRIEEVRIESVIETANELTFRTADDVSKLSEITLFGENFQILKKNSESTPELSGKGLSITPFSDALYAVQPAMKDKKPQILSGEKSVPYQKIELSELPETEVQALLDTKDVSVRNSRLVYSGEEENSVVLAGLPFVVKSEKLKFKKQLRDKKGNFIGTIIEVNTNNKSIGDLESNTDAFFKETTERLTDALPYRMEKSRSFRVGKTDENNNLLEIAEETNKGLVPIDESTLPKHLYAVPNDWQLKKQLAAINKLTQMPCHEQKYLLELFERKSEGHSFGAKWKSVQLVKIEKWYILTDESYYGCAEQREFVKKALATGDFSFLDGPPGSGKTTVLLEVIAQLIMKGMKVLLTASTNAAVDNILERLNKLPPEVQEKILAVRIGNEKSISETVKDYTLSDIPDEFHEEIIMSANVVCGTIFGVLKHPAFNMNDKNQPVRPLYDFLIIDEASKTTFQDFLIPALYSRHWILSGDLKQLTPYVEQDTIQSSLEEMPEFDRNMQRIQTLLWLAKDNRIGQKNMRFYIIVPSEQIRAAEMLVTENTELVGIISKQKCDNPFAVSVQELKAADKKSVILYGAKLLFIEDSAKEEVKKILPHDFVPMFDVAHDEAYSDLFLAASAERHFTVKKPNVELGSYRDKTKYGTWQGIAEYWTRAMREHSWAQEITWRLCRIQELFSEKANNKTVERYKREIEERMPSLEEKSEKIKAYCDALTGIALPSILQLLQNGLSEDVKKNFKQTTLNSGFEKKDFEGRHTMLTYQHRMHPSISAFSAKKIYDGKALKDGSELEEKRKWSCPVFGKSHDVWLDTTSKLGNDRDCTNENQFEVRIIKDRIQKFMEWTKDNPNPDKDSKGNWSVACLTYYKRQERNLKQAVKELFGEQREKSWYRKEEKHIEVFIYTVDKFQGREADVVFLSLVKSGKATLGFMDSPNRLNVALTRARFQRVIVGSHSYFRNTNKSDLLKNLAAESDNVEVVK